MEQGRFIEFFDGKRPSSSRGPFISSRSFCAAQRQQRPQRRLPRPHSRRRQLPPRQVHNCNRNTHCNSDSYIYPDANRYVATVPAPATTSYTLCDGRSEPGKEAVGRSAFSRIQTSVSYSCETSRRFGKMKNHTRVPRAPQDTRDRVGLLVGAIDFNFAWRFCEPPLFIEQHRVTAS